MVEQDGTGVDGPPAAEGAGAMEERIVARVSEVAQRRGASRRLFLASSAGLVTTLAVAKRLAGTAHAGSRRVSEGDPCLDADSVAPPGVGFRAGFTRVDEATQAEWLRAGMATVAQQPGVPATIMNMLRSLDGLYGGFNVDQLHHALQTATMAKRANASDETVLCGLLHDVGKVVSIEGHPDISSAILRPYVSEELYQVIRTHQDFQGKHYYGYLGRSTTLRDQYRSQSWFTLAERFTDEWDQAAFDPAYPIMRLEEFEPLVTQFFNQPTWRSPTVCG
jgi:predicted HD phosphohydrolase